MQQKPCVLLLERIILCEALCWTSPVYSGKPRHTIRSYSIDALLFYELNNYLLFSSKEHFVEKNIIIESEKMLKITDEVLTILAKKHSLVIDKAKNKTKQCVTQKLMSDIDSLIDRMKQNVSDIIINFKIHIFNFYY